MFDLDKIAAALSRHPQVSEWTARLEESHSTQLYLVGPERENLRTVTSARAVIEVHRDEGGQRGSASLVLAEDDLSRLGEVVDQAVFMASLNANPPFRLPAPQPYPTVQTVDAEIEADPRGLTLRLQERVLGAVAREAGIRVGNLEIFLTRGQTHLRTSSGVDARRQGTTLHLELVLAARQGDREGESYAAHRFRRAADLDVEREVARQARQARQQLSPSVPTTRRGAVVISGEAVESFFEPIVFHTSASARFRRMSRFDVGQAVVDQPLQGERLTLVSDALLPFGLNTTPFDDEGLPGQQVELVSEGLVSQLWATKRYADYLGLPPTGQLGNLVVVNGALSTEELLALATPTLHVETFSWFNPDPISGDFVAEVRVGYEREGQSIRPVKGGSVSGNVFAALANARFSRDVVLRGSYNGPEAIWLGELTISGR